MCQQYFEHCFLCSCEKADGREICRRKNHGNPRGNNKFGALDFVGSFAGTFFTFLGELFNGKLMESKIRNERIFYSRGMVTFCANLLKEGR
jgi:hypothetical protein